MRPVGAQFGVTCGGRKFAGFRLVQDVNVVELRSGGDGAEPRSHYQQTEGTNCRVGVRNGDTTPCCDNCAGSPAVTPPLERQNPLSPLGMAV